MAGVTHILAIDPGTTQSGWAVLNAGVVTGSGVMPNELLVERLDSLWFDGCALAVERFEARGMPMGDESIETILWTGRFIQEWRRPEEVICVKRSAVKLALCGTTKAKDANIRQALIDKLGPPGTKKNPGPTYGVKSHAWAALGVAVTAAGMVPA